MIRFWPLLLLRWTSKRGLSWPHCCPLNPQLRMAPPYSVAKGEGRRGKEAQGSSKYFLPGDQNARCLVWSGARARIESAPKRLEGIFSTPLIQQPRSKATGQALSRQNTIRAKVGAFPEWMLGGRVSKGASSYLLPPFLDLH